MRHLTRACAIFLTLTALAPAEEAREAAARQAELQRAFESFRQKLTVLAGRLEASDDPRERERAKPLRAALREAASRGTGGRFDTLILALSRKGAGKDLDALSAALRENAALREDLRKMLALLGEDTLAEALRKRADSLKEMLALLKELRGAQARLQTRTERGKDDPKALQREQEKLKERTEKALDGLDAPPKAKDAVGRAAGKQGKATGKLGEGKPGEAAEDQAGAIDDLDEAIREVEREQEEATCNCRRKAAEALLARAQKMLAMQIAIRDGIDKLYLDIREGQDEKPTLAHAGRANKLADTQSEALKECEAALKLLREEGLGVAFIEAFEEVEKDMASIRARLDVTDVGKVTQRIADDVVETLQEMVAALKKAAAEPPPPSGMPPGHPGPSPERVPLVELLQQLKMLQAMQRRVNGRTELYASRYTGEQAPKPESALDARERRRLEQVRKELGDLSARQSSLEKVTRGLISQSRE
jgi:hypothetical protein